ncbi:hypothetical protein Cyrtocomes_00718 [Candidatus Cyrtobacter comes]|uniref:Uncharacterized protein n=1 Tax=Candidatus Cyrtobacter comes TaxID=675776 RepID=A0ABU5L908_9RICK|nr:hypothetical protein [Candidatus Cyrtobacter comes]
MYGQESCGFKLIRVSTLYVMPHPEFAALVFA